jgi:hypothetical protein
MTDAMMKLVEKDQKSSIQVSKAKVPPMWVGTDFERWKIDILAWSGHNKDDDYTKSQDLLESLKKNPQVKQYVIDVLLDGTKVDADKMVQKVLELMSEKFAKTQPEHLRDLFHKMIKLEMGDDESCEDYWDRFFALVVEMEKEEVENHLLFLMSHFFVEGCIKVRNVSPEETIHLKDSLEKYVADVRVPKNKTEVVPALKKEFISLKIENNHTKMKSAPVNDTHFQDNRSSFNRSCYEAWKSFKNRPDFNNFQRSKSQKGMWRTQSGMYQKASCPPPG